MKDSKAKIVFLNGPSSSKSTLAKHLQEKLSESYLRIGIDQMIDMMPEKLNDYHADMKKRDGFYWEKSQDADGNNLLHLLHGPYAKKISELYQAFILCMANSGHNIIVDEVCLGEHNFAHWQKVLATYTVVYVGFKIPMEELEKREKQRGDRVIGSSRAQHMHVHDGAVYDVEITDIALDLDHCSDEIIRILSK